VNSDPFEDVLRVLEQSAFEERERARLLELDDNRHVFLQESEARFAPLEFFGQIAIERDFAQRGRFLPPLLRVGNLHRFSLVLDPSDINNTAVRTPSGRLVGIPEIAAQHTVEE
jgi:hypothetical protein